MGINKGETMKYQIVATYVQNGQELLCDRPYALGEYANQTWDDRKDAEAIAEELREDVGTVVDDSVVYFVTEI